jgi:hypothetical protein
VLESVDAALESATKAEKKTSKVVDERFEKAINALIDYEMDCHRKIAVSDGGRRANSLSVRERMDPARAKDKSSSTTLNALKEKSRMKVRIALAHVTSAYSFPVSQFQKNGRNQRKSSTSFSSSPFLTRPPSSSNVSSTTSSSTRVTI